MRLAYLILLVFVLGSCASFPPQNHQAQPEVLLHYDWWNNAIKQPVARVQLWNTTPELVTGALIDVCAWDAKGNELTSFRTYRKMELVAGDKKRFRLWLPGHHADRVEVSLVEFYSLESEGQSNQVVSSGLWIEELFVDSATSVYESVSVPVVDIRLVQDVIDH